MNYVCSVNRDLIGDVIYDKKYLVIVDKAEQTVHYYTH